MKRMMMKVAFATVFTTAPLVACTADIHDNTADVHDNTANIDDAQVEMDTDVDVDNVQQNQTIQVQLVAEDVYLIEPSQDPPPDRVEVAGHFQFYFDTLSSEPILITASKTVSITVPSDMQGGDHKLICRVHKHDGTPTEAIFELELKVTATVTTTN
ncbi:MAG TPA: hypothetical protein VHO25_24055 [Polyangiaceae bacterium]|nr:hypothetical protein [Polyangiaceae bacterium]